LPPMMAVPLYSPLTPYFILGAILFVIAAYLLLKAEGKFRKQGWRTRDGSFVIVLLVLVSALLAMPLVYGFAHNSFTERIETVETVNSYSFDLTEASPEISLDILELLPIEYHSIDILISEIYFDNPVRIRTQADTSFRSYLSEVNNFTNAGIEISIGESSTHILEIRRLNYDTSVTFDIIVVRSNLVLEADLSVAVILALLAIVPACIALFNARMFSIELAERHGQQSSSNIWNEQN